MDGMPLTFLYPSALIEDVEFISYSAKCAKVARYSPCDSCDCEGLHPPPGSMAISDDSEDAGEVIDAASSNEALTEEGLLASCACMHSYAEHGCDVNVAELDRRVRVAAQIDQLLLDRDKLLDFSYTDDDIVALRRQMYRRSRSKNSTRSSSGRSETPLSASGSGIGTKRRRSVSSASDEDDVPLAVQQVGQHGTKSKKPMHSYLASNDSLVDMDIDDEDADADGDAEDDPDELPIPPPNPPPRPAHGGPPREGKTTSKGHMRALASQSKGSAPQAVMTARSQAIEKEKEEKAKIRRTVGGPNEGREVDRLASGITVDPGLGVGEDGRSFPPTREAPAITEERAGTSRFEVVRNDGTPKSSILLTGLKNLFQKQLPNMPKEYIMRLVFDRNAQALALYQKGYKIVGGIAYRPFVQRGFIEIVFLAVHSTHQTSGYGSHLMNHFKAHVRRDMPTVMHFLTYADNYAVGYFRKQGFTNNITLPLSQWVGYIKDYEGGTLMQCTMLHNVDYLNRKEHLGLQKEAIMMKIRQMSRSHIVHSGLMQFKDAPKGFVMNHKDVPGLRESGWEPSSDEMPRQRDSNIERVIMKKLLQDLTTHADAWPFMKPVNAGEVVDYYDVIKNPMDFEKMEHKLETGQYRSLDDFTADAELVFANCKFYNNEASQYAKRAVRLERHFKECLVKRSAAKSAL